MPALMGLCARLHGYPISRLTLPCVWQVAGPEVIVSRSDNNALTCGSNHCSTIWNGTLVQMTELHQVLYLEAVIERCVGTTCTCPRSVAVCDTCARFQ